MNFLSFQFAFFTAIVLVLYYTPAFRSHQTGLLVISSLYFFGCADWKMLPLLLVAVVSAYGFLIGAMRGKRACLVSGIIFNLLLLAFFKYKFLFISNPSSIHTGLPYLDYLLLLPLPIGISFFIFHNISMLVDFTKRRDTVQAPRFNDSLLYIIFFPQLVSGPITRAQGFFPQLGTKLLREVDWVSATRWLILGCFMKSFCANNLNNFTSYLNTPDGLVTLAGLDRLFLIFLYSIQIYADFFGYSGIALGLALLFGYRLPINFSLPYLSGSLHEFWNRWHISLSRWLRIYLYFPLGGNRKGAPRTYFNLMTVMALGGLWHGAGFNYLLWGAFHGFLLCVERPFLHLGEMLGMKVAAPLAWVFHGARALAVFGLVSLAWLLFKFSTVGDMIRFVNGIIENPWVAFHSQYFYMLALLYCLPVFIQHFCSQWAHQRWFQRVEPAFYAFLIFLSVVEAGPGSTFIYFQF